MITALVQPELVDYALDAVLAVATGWLMLLCVHVILTVGYEVFHAPRHRPRP